MASEAESKKFNCPFFPNQELTPVDPSGFNNVLIYRCTKFNPIFIAGEGKCDAGCGFCGYSGENNGKQDIIVLGGEQTTDEGELTKNIKNQLIRSFKVPRSYVRPRVNDV